MAKSKTSEVSKKAHKMCYDKVLPNKLNKPHQMRVSGTGQLEAMVEIEKRWSNGITIDISFIGGTSAQHEEVKKHAVKWTQHANLNFNFVDDPAATIRISFDTNNGAWSYVGTDNLSVPVPGATMNLGWVDEGVILHEFGHMIGLAHEHQNPDGGIIWNEQVVLDDLAGPPNYWDEAKARHNVLNKYKADQIFSTKFDQSSIMLYAFRDEWTQNMGATHENNTLSSQDIAFVKSAKMYPGNDSDGSAVKATELSVLQATHGAISKTGEEDLYVFDIDSPGTYVIETNGGTDMYLSLFGPSDRQKKVADDDDSGVGRNPRIEAVLYPGQYFAQVRHFDSIGGVGDYAIQVVAR